MQRIACITQRPALLPSFSAGIRYNSTEVPPKPNGTVKRTVRVPVARLGNIRIPSAEEVRAKAAVTSRPSYAPDISYLDNASNNFLAAKLARLGRGETIDHEEETPEEKLPNVPRSTPPEDIAALTAKRREARKIRAADVARQPTPTPEDIAASTAKRREGRKMRTADGARQSTPTPEDIAALTAKRREDRKMRATDGTPPPDDIATSETKRREGQMRVADGAPAPQPTPAPEDIATLTAKRREDREMRALHQHLLDYVPVQEKSSRERDQSNRRENLSRRSPQGAAREQTGASPRRNERPKQHGPRQSRRRAPVPRATQSVTPSTLDQDEFDESIFKAGHEPEFNGPERLSSNLLDHFGPSFSAKDVTVVAKSGTTFKIPVSKVDSFYKSDYSRYISASNEDYASPPNALGAVKVAARTLSHQCHYNLTARDRTLELVAEASQSSPKPVIAKLTSHR